VSQQIVLKLYPTFKPLKGMRFMSENCIFCQIIRKEAPASIIYEDDQVTAFLSNRPVNVGHTLVVPKKYYENIYEIPEEEAAYLFKIVKRIAQTVKAATGIEGIRIVQNNGEAAGQVVFHLHIHIIPMRPGNQFYHENGFRDPKLLAEDAEKIKQHLGKAT
jgi:histidine triad (HIT) family protein